MEEGTQFGRYRLESKLGAGAMGEVYRAYDTETDRVVAVKVLVPHLAEDEKFQARFRQEARTAAGLNDPHVVPIHNFGEIDGCLYVDMRLIEGRDLGAVIAAAPMAPDMAVAVVEQIASALDAAHRAGLVHRDVKPSNILVTDRNFAYLIDFGIARGAESSGMTSVGHTIGTLAYMAPERFETGNADPRADIYALACVLHESLTGRRPFDAESLEQQIAAHMMAPPPRPSVMQLGVPNALDSVIAKGLAKNPNQRYRTAPELAAAARDAIIGGRWDAPSAQASAPTQQQRPPASYSHPRLAKPGTQPQPQSQPRPGGSYTPAPYGVVSRPGTAPVQRAGTGPTPQHPGTGPTPQHPGTGPQPPGHYPQRGSWWQRNIVALVAAIAAVVTIVSVAAMVATSGGDAAAEAPDLGAMLLTTDEMNEVMGVDGMTPIYRYFTLPEDQSTITPSTCYNITYSAGIKSYENSGYLAMREELAQAVDGSVQLPIIDQAIFQFPSATDARTFLDSMSQSWQTCLDQTVISNSPDIDVKDRSEFTDFVESDNMITVNTIAENETDPYCKRSLAVQGAYIVDVRACKEGVGDETEEAATMIFEKVPA